MTRWGLAAGALFILMSTARAEGQSTPYLPNDDIAYSYVDALMSRGMLRSLSALVRPYAVWEIRAALDSLPADRSKVVEGFAQALGHALKRYELNKSGESGDRLPFRAKATFDLYTTVQSSSLRELMIGDSGEDIKPAMAGYFVFGARHISGSVRALLDNRLNTDPEFPGRKDRKIAGRTEDGYVRGVWKYAEVAFGRVARSWGPTSLSGLQLGDDAYTYDHLFARAGTDRINVSTVIARLDNYALEPGLELSRYFSIHRFALRRGRFEGALSEAFVYSGVRRGLEFSLVNPFNVYGLSWRNERVDGNLNFGGELSFRSSVGTYAGHVLLDDIQIDECDTVCSEPTSYGVTLSAEGIPVAGNQRMFASYTRVSNLAYHTPNVGERYAIYSVGLGRGFSDYDEVRIGADLAIIPRTPLRAYIARRRQGEGDYRKAYPQNSAFERTPGFLSGTVWTVNRAGLSGATMIGRDFQVVGDVGVNQNTNRGNRAGYDRTIFEGRVKGIWVPRWLITFD